MAGRSTRRPPPWLVPPRGAELDPGHPLAPGLVSLWVPGSSDAGATTWRNLAPAGQGRTMAGASGTVPRWDGGPLGPSPAFDGVAVATGTGTVPWQPPFGGGFSEVTVAVVATTRTLPDPGGYATVYALQDGVNNTPWAGIALSGPDVGTLGGVFSDGGEQTILTLSWAAAGQPFAAVMSAMPSAVQLRQAVLTTGARQQGTAPSAVAGNFLRPPDTEALGAEFTAGVPGQFYDGTVHAALVWDRALGAAEMTAFLADPLGMLRSPRRRAVLAGSAAASGATLTATAALANPGATVLLGEDGLPLLDEDGNPLLLEESGAVIATADSSAGAVTLPVVVSLSVVGNVNASAAGATLTASALFNPGTANGARLVGGATVTATGTLTAGVASASNTAPGAGILAASATLLRGLAVGFVPAAARPSFGGGMGPGGDPELGARVRGTMAAAYADILDPEGALARKAAAAMRDAIAAEAAELQRTRPERMARVARLMMDIGDL